jgi:hypothetical protein
VENKKSTKNKKMKFCGLHCLSTHLFVDVDVLGVLVFLQTQVLGDKEQILVLGAHLQEHVSNTLAPH